MSKTRINPTESELQILQILWEKGPSTVRTVNEEMNKEKETGYTTTLKLMQIMTEKELVSRDTSQRTHVYAANITEHDTQKDLLDSFVATTFKGSAMSMVMQALGNHRASKEELDAIKQLISKLEKE